MKCFAILLVLAAAVFNPAVAKAPNIFGHAQQAVQ
jgi:hypothetical protein